MSEQETEGTRPDRVRWRTLAELAEAGDRPALEALLDSLPPGESARALAHLGPEARADILRSLDPEPAAALLRELPDSLGAEMVADLDPADAATAVQELQSDEVADLLSEIEDAERVLAALEPESARALRELVAYEPDTAGGLMRKEYLAYRQDTTVQELLDDLRSNAERYSDYEIQYAYVVDASGGLRGVLRLRDLILASPGRLASELTLRDPHSVSDLASLDELLDFFEEHVFLGAPVVDAQGRLVGVVERAAVFEASGDRAESDRQKALGIVGGEELRSLPLAVRSRRRLAWLSANVVLNLIAASVIAFFEDTLQQVIALAVFLPIISDMSGCSGNQAVAVSLRELSLGLVKPHEVLHVWLKEVSVGLINGAALGLLLAVAAVAWKGNPWLGLVVGLALAINTVVAVSLGGLVPLVLRRLRVDPAVASGPLLTTVTDLCGFLLVLGIATLLLERLT